MNIILICVTVIFLCLPLSFGQYAALDEDQKISKGMLENVMNSEPRGPIFGRVFR